MSSKFFAVALVASVLLGVALADNADDRFAACCEEKGVDKSCCKYRRGSVHRAVRAASVPVQCLTTDGFAKFSSCATGGKDNTDCCKKADVKDALCLELCDGTKPISHPNPYDYYNCASARGAIVKCNQEANEK